MKKVLVTGAYGYIGSHTVKALAKQGYIVDALDNEISNNNITPYVRTIKIGNVTAETIGWGKYDTIIHLAAKISVEESVKNPWNYFYNNVIGTRNLMRMTSFDNIIFASTALAFNPYSSPYAQSKLMAENVIKEYARLNDKHFTIFRFFNVAGDDGEFKQIGEATHLVRIAAETAAGKRDHIKLYGTDWNTPDGTCVRDYIHVSDLVDGIVEAVKRPADSEYECIGTGIGHSCLQVINTMKDVSKRNFTVIDSPRRMGDPEKTLLPGNEKISDYVLCKRNLIDICASAYYTEFFDKKSRGVG